MKTQHACIDNFSYTRNINMGATDNAVVIAAHAVVHNLGGAAALTFVSGASGAPGTTLPGTVVNHRVGNVAGFTPVNIPLVAAWEPDSDTDPSFWDNVIAADPSGNGSWLLNNGADWVWESYRTTDPQQGSVIEVSAIINVPAATTGTFRITCDNGYRVDLNGVKIAGGDGASAGYTTQLSDDFATLAGLATNTNLKVANVNADGWQSVEAYPVSLLAGANTFRIFGVNEYELPDDIYLGFPTGPGARGPGDDIVGTIDNNPSGCIFGLVTTAVPGTGSQTAWGAPNGFSGSPTAAPTEAGGNFPGENWATFFTYQVR
jgi:hypothetical protein